MADVPVPGQELTPVELDEAIPPRVLDLLRSLWSAGHAAYVVGGSVRDPLMGRPTSDQWDLATSARPEQMLERFAGEAVYENRFGTVVVRRHGQPETEITTFRSDHDYADFRRPHRIEFTDSIELDLARRDFTVNAMAWGARAGESPTFVDPHGGRADLEARLLRAVGEPEERFREDALRMVRAIRLAATLDFAIEPATLAGITAQAELVAHLSGERIAVELSKLLAAPRPSVGLRLLADTGLLDPISPELAAQRGVPQNKVPGEDLWDHTLRSVDAAVAEPPRLRLAALLHDMGKPSTFSDGRFLRHEVVGAELAATFLDRLRWPHAERDRVVHLVRQHMFGYQPSWSDTAVRRFIAKVGRDALDDLFRLREADNIGSGSEPSAGHLDVLRARVAAELAANVVLDRHGLAIDGDDLMAELGLAPGPGLGRILDRLLEAVIADPRRNRRDALLKLARSMAAERAS
jgi:tRNA nucleotidyltransferase (CCA-adding enzyme)